jgi:hypothetical protein
VWRKSRRRFLDAGKALQAQPAQDPVALVRSGPLGDARVEDVALAQVVVLEKVLEPGLLVEEVQGAVAVVRGELLQPPVQSRAMTADMGSAG